MKDFKRYFHWLFFVGILLSMHLQDTSAQTFIPIWEDQMPNSKGLKLRDSIYNDRAYQIGTPGLYVYETSKTVNTGAAVVIIPGGGYARLSFANAGIQLAKWYNTFGVTAFILFHRLPQSPDVVESYKAPLQDAQRAIKWIHNHAADYGIQRDKIGVMGCSAGGHLSASVSVFEEDWSKIGDAYDTIPFRPNFAVLVSPVITMGPNTHAGTKDQLLGRQPSEDLIQLFSLENQVTASTPPTFMVHAHNDAVSAMNSILYYTALKAKNIAGCSLHIFPAGGHNIALRNNPGTTNMWSEMAENWLVEIGMITH